MRNVNIYQSLPGLEIGPIGGGQPSRREQRQDIIQTRHSVDGVAYEGGYHIITKRDPLTGQEEPIRPNPNPPRNPRDPSDMMDPDQPHVIVSDTNGVLRVYVRDHGAGIGHPRKPMKVLYEHDKPITVLDGRVIQSLGA